MKKRKYRLGPDRPELWVPTLLEMDAALAGKKTKYWKRVVYPRPVGKDQVKALRKQLHFSQLALAQALGMSLSTVRSWEQGTKKPTGLASKVLRRAIRKPELVQELAAA